LTPEVEILPKFAATLASLLLIASSIGVNIARYPQVGRTINAGQRTDVAEPIKSAPAAEESSRVETANQDSLAANKIEIEPAKSPQVAAVAPLEPARVEEFSAPQPAAGNPHSPSGSNVPILDVRPMVPVASLRAAGESEPPGSSDEVRRLPPVEPSVFAVDESQAAGSGDPQPYLATSTP